MSTVHSLRERGHEAIHLREEGLRQLPDEKILEKARQEGRIVLTFDLDFGDLMATGASMPKTATVDEIVETLKRVPKARLRIVRDVAEALAESGAKSTHALRRRATKKKSLLDTPFRGMWADRTDIIDSQSFARALRHLYENALHAGERPAGRRRS